MENSTLQSQQRGMLTPRIKAKSLCLLGYEITQAELRLMPYVQSCLISNQPLNKTSQAEQQILAEWRKKGFFVKHFNVTKEFWDAMSEIIWLGYVDLVEFS